MLARLCYLTRVHRHLSATILVALFLMACPKQTPAPDLSGADAGAVIPPGPTGPGLIVKVEPTDAELIIDGRSYGAVAQLETRDGLLPLKSGIYQVSVKRAGYAPWRAEVTVNDRPETLQVTLVRKP